MFPIDSRLHTPSSWTRIFSRVSVFDVLWAGISPALAYVVRDGWIDRIDAVEIYCGFAFIASVLTFQWFKISAPVARFFSVHDAVEVVKACLISVAVAGALLFTFTRMEETPRSIPILHFFVLATGLLGVRIFSRIRAGWRESRNLDAPTEPVENIAVIGTSRLAWFFTKLVEELASGESQIVAILDERPELQHRSINGHPIVGSPLHISKIVDEYAMHGVNIHRIVVAESPENLSKAVRAEIDRVSQERSIILDTLPERLFFTRAARPQVSQANNIFSKLVQTADRPLWKIKRILDVLLAIVMMVAVSPIALVVAALVLIDVGYPIIFWQQRVGRLGRRLHVYKFRTMHAPFDRKHNPIPKSERLSRIGLLLQLVRLDEIPQLWNILSGGMSVIGPRPLLPVDQPKTISLRLQVRPGLTGLAQINGGKLLSVEEKDALDEHYVLHASLFLDLNILVRTALVMFRGDRRDEDVTAAALAEKRARTGSETDVAPAPEDTAIETEKSEAKIRIAKILPSEPLTFIGRRRKRANLQILS